MKGNRMRWILSAAGIAMLAAASLGAQGIPVQKDRTPAPAAANQPPMGNMPMHQEGMRVMQNDMRHASMMNDAQIMNFLIMGDSMEVALGNQGVARGTSAELRAIAQSIATDHAASLAEGREMAVDEDIGRQAMPGMMAGPHMAQMHGRMATMAAGDAWDREWLMHQVMHHRHTLEMLNAVEPRARDDDLKQKIQELRPVVQGHLDRLVALANSWGMNTAPHAGH